MNIQPKSFRRMWTRFAIFIGAVLALALFEPVYGQSAAPRVNPGVLPTSPLYVLDTWAEGARLALTRNPDRHAQLATQYAQEKVAEVQEVVQEDQASQGATDDRADQGTTADAQRLAVKLSEIEPGWIEIFNPNSSDVRLEGFKLTVSSGFLQSYDFLSSDVIPAQGYFIAEAATTGLNIPSAGGIVQLSSLTGFHEDITVPSFVPDSSYAWIDIADSISQWECTLNITPEAANLRQSCSTRDQQPDDTSDRTPTQPPEEACESTPTHPEEACDRAPDDRQTDERRPAPKLYEIQQDAIELISLHSEAIDVKNWTMEFQLSGTSQVFRDTIDEETIVPANGYVLVERGAQWPESLWPFTIVRLISPDGQVFDQITTNTDLTNNPTFAWAYFSGTGGVAPGWRCTGHFTPLAANQFQPCVAPDRQSDDTPERPPTQPPEEACESTPTHPEDCDRAPDDRDDPTSNRANVRFNEIHRNAFEIKNYSNNSAAIKNYTIEVRVGGISQMWSYIIPEETNIPTGGLFLLKRDDSGLSVNQFNTFVSLLSPEGVVLDQVEVLYDPTIETNSWSWITETSQWNCTEQVTLGDPNVDQACVTGRDQQTDDTPERIPPETGHIDDPHNSDRSEVHANEFTPNQVELLNSGSVPFDLAGYTMSVSYVGSSNKYSFPAGTSVPSGGYLTVSSAESGITMPMNGVIWRLRDPAGMLIKEVIVPAFPQVGDVSYAFFWAEPAGFDHTCLVTMGAMNQYQACSDRDRQPEDTKEPDERTPDEQPDDRQPDEQPDDRTPDEQPDEQPDDANEPVNDIPAKADLNEINVGFIELRNPGEVDHVLEGDLRLIKSDGSIVQHHTTGVVPARGYLVVRQTGIIPETGDVVQFQDQSGNTQTVEVAFINDQSSSAWFAEQGWTCTGTVTPVAENILSDCLIAPEETPGETPEEILPLQEGVAEDVQEALDHLDEYMGEVGDPEELSEPVQEEVLEDIEQVQEVLEEVVHDVPKETQDAVIDEHQAAEDVQDQIIDDVAQEDPVRADELEQLYNDETLEGTTETPEETAVETTDEGTVPDEETTPAEETAEETTEETTEESTTETADEETTPAEETAPDSSEALEDRTPAELWEDARELADDLSDAVQQIETLRQRITDLEDEVNTLKEENKKLRDQLRQAGVNTNTDEGSTETDAENTNNDTTDSSEQPTPHTTGERVDIQLRLLRFIPNELIVSAGTPLRFINQDKPQHSLQFSDGYTSGVMEHGQSFDYIANSSVTVFSIDSEVVPPIEITVQ